MTREERLRFCKVCKNRKFDQDHGIVCGLTNRKADFEGSCEQFDGDLPKSEQVVEKLKDNSKRASLIIKVFWGIAIVNVLAVVSNYLEIVLLVKIRDGVLITDEEAIMNDTRQGVIALFQSVLYLTSIITFLNWFRRAYGNLHRLGRRLSHDESMAVWAFFIPIISLFRPYQIAKEIFHETRRTAAELGSQVVPSGGSSILGIWWALFILTNWIGQFAFKAMFKEETLEQMINTSQAYLISDFVDIPAAIVTLYMIHIVSKDENEIYKLSAKSV